MKTKVALVGVGDISGIYLKNITKRFTQLELVGVCDLVREKAEQAAKQYGVKIYDDMHALFADEQVDIVLNLTRPDEHFAVTQAALLAGKHVYTEKPLAATFEQGKALFELARQKNLWLGGAPDTFMGAGIQGSRALLEEIGQPVGFAAHMICRGHESWHPDPEFYYKHGGGPMLDMGPYYVTALVQLFGPVQSVMAMTKRSYATRHITSEPLRGGVIEVDVPTHYTCLLRFAGDVTGTLVTSFDAYPPGVRNIELYGSLGTLSVPDPNNFDGDIQLQLGKDGYKKRKNPVKDYAENSRGVGLADMASAMQEGRPAQASAELILHVLEVLTAFERSSQSGQVVEIN
ncbi:MAG: Gfo/Idh/MocA family oxidoreductase [Oscillospiraceae bacterium]|nr:Gfo/Idh/MocA family oxidoreductase [Oscillospiraceae bacterium]